MNPILRAALVLAASAVTVAHAADYNTNLVVNGDAENGTTGWSQYSNDIPLFLTDNYGANWVLPTQPGPDARGESLFVGGSGASYVAGVQSLDLSANFADIATGKVNYTLSGWLGGWTSQADNAMFSAVFLDAGGNELETVALGPLTPDDRNNTTGLFFLDATGMLPTATDSVMFVLDMERYSGGDIDGYADNLSFVMAPVPEPETYAMLLAGLGLMGAIARRRKR